LTLVWKLLKKIFEEETSTAIFRYGWEEFAVLSRLTQTAIYDKISTFLTQLEKMNLWKNFWWKDVYLTASSWITQMDIHKHFQPSDLVNDADKKLYSSKNNGRNQITL
jgi:GGDEF domain-containing protein